MCDAFIKMMNEEWRIIFYNWYWFIYLFHHDWIYANRYKDIGEIKHHSQSEVTNGFVHRCNFDRWLACFAKRKKFTADGLSELEPDQQDKQLHENQPTNQPTSALQQQRCHPSWYIVVAIADEKHRLRRLTLSATSPSHSSDRHYT